MDPPDPISNSEVKRFSADGSVGLPHVRVGHRQAYTPKGPNQIFLVRAFYFVSLVSYARVGWRVTDCLGDNRSARNDQPE